MNQHRIFPAHRHGTTHKMWLTKLAANLSAKEDDLNNDVLDKNNQAYGDDDFQSYGLDPNEGW